MKKLLIATLVSTCTIAIAAFAGEEQIGKMKECQLLSEQSFEIVDGLWKESSRTDRDTHKMRQLMNMDAQNDYERKSGEQQVISYYTQSLLILREKAQVRVGLLDSVCPGRAADAVTRLKVFIENVSKKIEMN